MLFIALGFVLGIIIGWIISATAPPEVKGPVGDWFKAFGDIFVRLIRIVIPPLIFFTIAAATASIANARKLGKILALMLFLYIITTIIASVWGIIAATTIAPGVGLNLTSQQPPPTPPSGIDILLSFFKPDFSDLLVVGGAMTMIIFAIILGLSVTFLGDEG
ncbi:MAG: cation:dicarboxylate symporter family transporter, partial [Zestosphaera sp.]